MITQKNFDKAHYDFLEYIKSVDGCKYIDFKINKFINDTENYKYEVAKEARDSLNLKLWIKKEYTPGKGLILKSVKNSIQPDIIYNGRILNNNLIDWRKKDNFKKLKKSERIEKLFFDFFKGKEDEVSFVKLYREGFSYQEIAYLFFIKNSQNYMPISQVRFDKIFKSLDIELKTSNNCSWENYTMYNKILREIKKLLSVHYKKISLIDSHSFLWIYGRIHFEESTRKNNVIELQQKNSLSKPSILVKDQGQLEKDNEFHQPNGEVELGDINGGEGDNLEIDYIEKHKRQIEIGKKGEDIVIEHEKKELISFPNLSKKVRSVSNNPKLGVDIISFETNSKQKQIEVKVVTCRNGVVEFFLTENELLKSKSYPNYYLYCVLDINSDNPQIIKLKQPQFDDSLSFLIKPILYKVAFK